MDWDSLWIRSAFLIALLVAFFFIYITIDAANQDIFVRGGLVVVAVIGVFFIFMDFGGEKKKKK